MENVIAFFQAIYYFMRRGGRAEGKFIEHYRACIWYNRDRKRGIEYAIKRRESMK